MKREADRNASHRVIAGFARHANRTTAKHAVSSFSAAIGKLFDRREHSRIKKCPGAAPGLFRSRMGRSVMALVVILIP
jgi:hypothetical protein